MILQTGFPGEIIPTTISNLPGGVGRQGIPDSSQKRENQTNSAFHTRTLAPMVGPKPPSPELETRHQAYQCGDLIPGVEVSIGLPGWGWTV